MNKAYTFLGTGWFKICKSINMIPYINRRKDMLHDYFNRCKQALVFQLCPTLCNPITFSSPCSSCPWDSPGKNNGVSCHSLLQGIFPTEGLNLGLLHCRQILYHLSHQGSLICVCVRAHVLNRGRCLPASFHRREYRN